MSVKTRLLLTLATLAGTLLIVGVMGLHALQSSNEDLNGVFSNNVVSITSITGLMSATQNNILGLDEALLGGDAASLAAFNAESRSEQRQSDELWTQYSATPMSADEKQLAQDFTHKRAKYHTSRDAIAVALKAGNLDEARKLRVAQFQHDVDGLMSSGRELLDLQTAGAKEANENAETNYARAVTVSWSAIILGMGIAGVSAWLLITSIVRSLHQAVTVSERIANGELGQNIHITRDDEFGRLLMALRNMDARLSEIVGAVRTSSDEVASAARQISHGNDDLSQRTQEQASALEETASSMEEMTATVKQNADNARQASQLASGTREQADRGGAIVGQAVAAMGEISESSRRIADIIDVIDEIAFQTNLLALNAAVEAARAGEQGRGFAVVATEVRTLAQRSASAAKEIKDLIGDSVAKVKTGTTLVDDSGRALTDIVASVKKVADIVAEISAASEEQASGIDQVNTAVTEMDSVTQQNAALVEEASAASKSMEHQAQSLIEKIGFFKIGNRQLTSAVTSSPQSTQRTSQRVIPLKRTAPASRPAVRSAPSKASAPAPQLARASGDDSWQEF